VQIKPCIAFFSPLTFYRGELKHTIKIAAKLAIKLVGYCTVSCLRRDIGGDYAKMEIEGILNKTPSGKFREG